jgi:Leucine-rich repeat (LRR) protein
MAKLCLMEMILFLVAGICASDAKGDQNWPEREGNLVLELDGDGDYVEVGSSPSLQLDTFTMEAWVSFNAVDVEQVVVGKLYNGFLWLSSDATGTIYAMRTEFRNVGDTSWRGITQDGGDMWTPQSRTWYHFATTWDGERIRLFVNGNLMSETGPIDEQASQVDEMLAIGRWGRMASRYFDGFLDEVRVWNFARSHANIQSTRASSLRGDETGLVGWWNFDESDENGRIPDLSGEGNDGLLKGDARLIGLSVNVIEREKESQVIPEGTGMDDDLRIEFADPNLETVVRKAIGNSVGDISPSDVAELTFLDASGREISELSGIENLTQLAELKLDENRLVDISILFQLTRIRNLSLNKNQIKDISPLSPLVNLEKLSLDSNRIEDISPLSPLVNLEKLSLDRNRFTSISPLSKLSNLTELYIQENPHIISISPLSSMGQLKRLDLTANRHGEGEIGVISSLVELVFLNISYNDLTDISFLSNLIHLEYLFFYGNQIRDLSPLEKMKKLKVLFAMENQVNDISILAMLPSLSNLLLSRNKIEDISSLLDNEEFGQGDNVDLTGNPLTQEALWEQIPALQKRGVEVNYGEPKINEILSIEWAISFQEVREEAGMISISAILNEPVDQEIHIPFTIDGTATGTRVDHDLDSGTITIPPGSTTGNLVFNIIDDQLAEFTETIVVELGAINQVERGSITTHVVRIIDNDSDGKLSEIPSDAETLPDQGEFIEESGLWDLDQVVNLGPRSGSGIDGMDMAIDYKRDKVFIGNRYNVSIVDLKLNVATGIIEEKTLKESYNLTRLAINERLDELYILGSTNLDELMIYDLNSLSLKNSLNWRSISSEEYEWSFVGNPLIVDEQRNYLYVGNEGGISVIDLKNREWKRLVSTSYHGLRKASAIDLAIDKSQSYLFVLYNGQDYRSYIDIINLNSMIIERTIDLTRVDAVKRILVDPNAPYIYALYNEFSEVLYPKNFARIRLDDNVVEWEWELNVPNAYQLFLDERTYKIWGMGRNNSLTKIDLDNFEIEEEKSFPIPITIANIVVNKKNDEVLVLGRGNVLYRSREPVEPIDATIVIGPVARGVAVSETKNQVYVTRGELGGFYVLDANGKIIKSVEGNVSSDIFIDDVSRRIFVFAEKDASEEKIDIYNLSTLQRLNTISFKERWAYLDILKGKPDYKRQIFWIPGCKALAGLDLISGREVKWYDFSILEKLGAALDWSNYYIVIHSIAIDAEEDKAFIAITALEQESSEFIGAAIIVFDLEREYILDVFDMSSYVLPNRNYYFANALAMDEQKQNLYVICARSTLLINLNTGNVVSYLNYENYYYRSMEESVFDWYRGRIYGKRGSVINLDSLSPAPYFHHEADEILDFAINRRTNRAYLLKKWGDLVIYTDPEGSSAIPPLAPSNTQAAVGDQQVILSWNSVVDSTLVGYHVYRQDQAETPFTRITSRVIADTTFTDTDLINGQTYTYQVSSVGEGNIESYMRSDPVSVTPIGAGYRLMLFQQNLYVKPGKEVTLLMSAEALEDFEEEVSFTFQGSEGIKATFSPPRFTPPQIVGLTVSVAGDVELGTYPLVIEASGGDQTLRRSLTLEVTDIDQQGSLLSLDIDQVVVPIDIPLLISGRLRPAMPATVQLMFQSARTDSLVFIDVETNEEGEFRAEFWPPSAGQWQITGMFEGTRTIAGTQSRTQEFESVASKTRISCTTDLPDKAETGWIGTVKGRIYPNPGTVAVNLKLRKPDGSEELIEGVLSSSKGFYGHDVRMDQAGWWEIQASWIGNDQLVGAVSNKVTVPVEVDLGRVILVACGEDRSRDIFWSTANYLGNLAYKTFVNRRLLKERVFYLNDRNQDVNRDGFKEDVDEKATLSGMSSALEWARERVNADNPLCVYLIGQGTPDGLRISENEVLNAQSLSADVVALEEATGTQATIIVEASHAGNFVRELSDQGRTVLTSTGMGRAYYQAEGYLSFSQFFLTDLYQGKSVQESFLHTHNILRNMPGDFGKQEPGLEAEGNLIVNQPGDYQQTLNAFIGAPFELGNLSPQIKSTSLATVARGAGKRVITQSTPMSEGGEGPQLRLAKTVAQEGIEIWARIDDAEGSLDVVRAMIMSLDREGQEGDEYPEVELHDEDGDGKWIGTYDGFLEEGVYPVVIYALDDAGNAADPLRTTTVVVTPDEDFITGIEDEEAALPIVYALEPPYPNPFNSEVVLKYALPEGGDVELVVYNALGQVVHRLADGYRSADYYQTVWNGKDEAGMQVATGMYVIKMQAGEFAQVRKVALVK